LYAERPAARAGAAGRARARATIATFSTPSLDPARI